MYQSMWFGTVRYEITVRYGCKNGKSTVRYYGSIIISKFGTVRKYDIFFVLLSYFFRTISNLTQLTVIDMLTKPCGQLISGSTGDSLVH